MTLDQLKAEVLKAGFSLSGSCYEDRDFAYASSLEVHPDSYCHPKFVACLDKRTVWVLIGKKSFKIS